MTNNRGMFQKGDKHRKWKGGHNIVNGYMTVYMPDHPRAYKGSGRVYESILIAEKALGRTLKITEYVYHIDRNPLNCSPRNLIICQDKPYLIRIHARNRIVRLGGNPDTQKYCNKCLMIKDKSEFYSKETSCKKCHSIISKERYRRMKNDK